MAQSNLEVVQRGFEAAGRGDLAVLGELLDPAVRWHGAGDDEGGCQNREQALEFIRRALEEGASPRVEWLVEAGELVVAVMGAARPAEGDDEPDTHGLVVRLVEGRIAEMTVYPTPDEALATATLRAGA